MSAQIAGTQPKSAARGNKFVKLIKWAFAINRFKPVESTPGQHHQIALFVRAKER
jgi:hypothetical protein